MRLHTVPGLAKLGTVITFFLYFYMTNYPTPWSTVLLDKSYHVIYHIISYHVISYHIISYIIPCHIISYIISYHIPYVSYISYQITSYIASHRIVSQRIITCDITSRQVTSHHITSHHISYNISVSKLFLRCPTRRLHCFLSSHWPY